jgi:C4-dicarboxylate-specific signal transduction histidine kinase
VTDTEAVSVILDLVPGMTLIARDAECRTIIGNSAAYKLLRLPNGTNISKSVSEQDRPSTFRILRDGRQLPANHLPVRMAAATAQPVRNSELTVAFGDGSSIDLLGNAAPLLDEQGAVKGAIGVFVDITERKQAQQALRETRAELAHATRLLLMGELLATIAHEVNQPLTGVVTNGNFALSELAKEAPKLDQVQEAVAWMVEDGKRASAVISRVRSLLKKDAPCRTDLDINDAIHEVVVLVRDETSRNRVQVRLRLMDGLPRVVGDRVQLQQVLINLIMNAIEAMKTINARLRQLIVASEAHSDGVVIRVQDSGVGLDPNRANRIFEPYFTTKPHGIGLGLAISRSIIESCGGRLWTESSADGATFQFTLPVNSPNKL